MRSRGGCVLTMLTRLFYESYYQGDDIDIQLKKKLKGDVSRGSSNDNSLVGLLCSFLATSSLLDVNLQDSFLDTAINSLLANSVHSIDTPLLDKADAMYIIVLILEKIPVLSLTSSTIGKLCNFSDKIPSLIENIANTQECSTLCCLINIFISKFLMTSIKSNQQDNIQNRLLKVMPKIISTCIRQLGKDEVSTINVACDVLISLAKCPTTRPLFSNSSTIIQLCSKLFVNTSVNQVASSLIAILVSLESNEGWSTAWQFYLNELVHLCKYIGIISNKNEAVTAEDGAGSSNSRLQLRSINSDVLLKCKSGIEKVIMIERLFSCYCHILQGMLSYGVSNTLISIEISVFLQVISSVLTCSTHNVASSDSKAMIENKNGISVVHLSIVSPQLKLNCLVIITELLQIHHSSLLPIGNTLVTLISPMLAAPNMALLKCYQLLCASFPTIIVKQNGLSHLLLLLEREMYAITTSKVSIIADDEVVHISDEKIDLLVVLFETCELLLLSCGPILQSSSRELLEVQVGLGLYTLSKGVIIPQLEDRKISRNPSAMIRYSTKLQNSLLKLAVAEIIASPSNGVVSGNIPLLRNAAQCCIYNHETSSNALKALMIVDSQYTPTSIIIPTVPAVISGKCSIDNKPKSLQSTVPTAISEPKEEIVSEKSGELPGDAKTAKKRKNKQINEKNDDKIAETTSFQPKKATVSSKSASASKEKVVEVTEEKNGDNDDDSIPDIVF